MISYVKGKMVQKEGDYAVVELNEDELGRAVLNYIINNKDSSIGEKFMKNLFNGNGIDLNSILFGSNNQVECNLNNNDDNRLKKNENRINQEDKDVAIDKDELEESIKILREKKSIEMPIETLRNHCPTIYSRIFKDKGVENNRLWKNYSIKIIFDEYMDEITYCFINENKGMYDEITPDNNVVLRWEDANKNDIEELLYI